MEKYLATLEVRRFKARRTYVLLAICVGNGVFNYNALIPPKLGTMTRDGFKD